MNEDAHLEAAYEEQQGPTLEDDHWRDDEEDFEPCCLLYRKLYPQDHEYDCPLAKSAREGAI